MKRLRFEPTRFSTVVDYVVRHIRPPSHPSTTSQSQDLESGTDNTSAPSRARSNSKNINDYVMENKPKSRFRTTGGSKQESTGSRARGRRAGSRTNSNSRFGDDEDQNIDNNDKPPEPVSHIVVDNDFAVFVPAPRSESGSTRTPGGGTGFSEHGNTGTESADGMSIRRDRRDNWIQRSLAYELIVERIAPSIAHFFDSSFQEPKKESLYRKEQWFTNKTGALACTSFYFLAWLLTCALSPRPLSTLNYVCYIGVAGFFTLPLVFFVAGDFPRRRPVFWNLWLMIASWIWACILIGEMHQCGFFDGSKKNTCGSRNFLNMMGWAYGPPVLALLAMQQARFYAAFGACSWAVLVGVLLMRSKDSPQLFYRNIVQFLLFHALLIATSFLRERSDRTLFSLRQQLKIQYRATQSAQVAERKAADSKKRFVSYIFHEARIPLNTALLAFQNLEGERVFDSVEKDQIEMVDALSSSLTMMEKVLNDVLSFSRMEAGRFKQISQPFNFHQAIQLVAMSHRAQAAGSGLELQVELDEEVDKTGGVFMGDEMRLRQVISNLVSNAIKFTPAGHVKIKTNLLYPRAEPTPFDEKLDPIDKATETAQNLHRELQKDSVASSGSDTTRVEHDEKSSVTLRERSKSDASFREHHQQTNHVIIRIEVQDQGVGLRNSDVVDSQLFTAFVQSEVGRRQGGKGFGLGLAIVRAIVKLSNGRLGVESQSGVGSTFWVEFPYSLPPPKTRAPEPSNFQHQRGSGSLPVVKVQDKAYEEPHRPALAPTSSSFMPLLPPAGPDSMPVASEDVMDSFAATAIGEIPSGQMSPDAHPIFVDPFRPPLDAGPSTPSIPLAGSPTKPTVQLPPLRTLVVDDDQLTRKLMSRMLIRMGHSVQQAENGKIALDILTADMNGPKEIDVCFLDNQMPIMSGVEVVDELRKMGSHLFVVGCTGNALREDQDEYLDAGVDKVLTKPIKEKDLKEMVAHARQRLQGLTAPARVGVPVPSPGI